MEISELLTVEGVIADLRASSKKHALQELARHAALLTELNERVVFDTLLERERLGTTGVGGGLAIPHGKFAELDRIHGMFARLHTPVDFESIDDRPVDLIFLLLAPEDAGAEHLRALARISRLLRGPALRDKLRGADSRDALYALLTLSADQDPKSVRAAG